MPSEQLLCYNRGCGSKYDPENNKDDSCRHHPGAPFFHDAYKGWSCCNKKCTDFTEFLNIKGCTLAKHSNVKPPEPEKPKTADIPDTEVIEIKPIVAPTLERPPFDTPMTIITAQISPSLKQQLPSIEKLPTEKVNDNGEIALGTSCKNGGCTSTYQGPDTNNTVCVYHPGVPIFHEGMKYWSCCQKKTSDFNAFLSQVGCERGTHIWKKDSEDDNTKVQCRWDYHQTGSFVIVAIYAKQYSPSKSVIKLSPIRLYANLVFPQQSDASFELDLELRGIIDVCASEVTMYGTKVELKLKKAEPGSWARLEMNRVAPQVSHKKVEQTPTEKLVPKMEDVDLSDL